MKTKKILALVLSVLMLATLLPNVAFAADLSGFKVVFKNASGNTVNSAKPGEKLTAEVYLPEGTYASAAVTLVPNDNVEFSNIVGAEGISYTALNIIAQNGRAQAKFSDTGGVSIGKEPYFKVDVTVPSAAEEGFPIVLFITLNGSNAVKGGETYTIPTDGCGVMIPKCYDITDKTAQDANGSIEIDNTTAAKNDIVTVTVKPNSGYRLKALTVVPTAGGEAIATEQDAQDENKYTFEMPAAAVTVTAEFEEAAYTVTITAEADGFTYGDSGKVGYKNVSVQDNLVATSDLDITYYLADGTTKTNTAEGASVEGGMPKNAGNYKVVISVPEANETYAGSKTVDFTIAKKAVTVQPANVSVYANGTAELTLDVSKLLKGDQAYTGTPTFKITNEDGEEIALADAVKNVGAYTITWTNPDDITFNENYDVTKTETATLTVSKKSSGGGRGSSSYTVKFETNGGNALKNVSVRYGQKIGTIETPKKEGFVFDGWYQDKELTKPFNADEKVTKSTTLYANWKVDPVRQIVLTIGKKEATVFTKEMANDVAPKIVNDRTMLPIRFIAEALGATVDWNGEKELVTISNEGLKIEITIGKDIALVNGEEVKLDSPAFIENDRTYLPLRFVAENLGAEVEWFEATQQVVITK